MKRPDHPISKAPPLWLAALLLSAGSAQAQFKLTESLTLSGFGTLGVTAISTDAVDYSQPSRPDRVDRSGDAGLDSKLALQANYRLAPSLVGVLQVIAKHTAEDTFEPSPEWAFVRWGASERLSLRAGRIGAPFFMHSDSRDVNYVQLTARPAFDVYGQVPVSHFDGADVVYRIEVGEASLSASAWGGRSTSKVSDVAEQGQGAIVSKVTLDKLYGLNLSLALDNGLTLRAGTARTDVSLGADDADVGAMGLTAEQSGQVMDILSTRRRPITFSGVGAMLEHGPWRVNAEYTWLRSSTQIADTTGWYVNAGYRWGTVTPFIGLSQIRVDDLNLTNPLTAYVAQPGPLGDVARQIRAYLAGGQVAQRTLTLGARWDLVDKVALKVQWDRIFKPAGSFGAFHMKPGRDAAAVDEFYNSRRQIDVMTLNLDVVF